MDGTWYSILRLIGSDNWPAGSAHFKHEDDGTLEVYFTGARLLVKTICNYNCVYLFTQLSL